MYQKIALVSKKNKVYRIKDGGKSHILKTFTDIKSFNKELEVLSFLNKKDILAPLILNTSEDSITLEDLGETTLLSTYEELEENNDKNYQDIIGNLLSWLESFYKAAETYYGRECILGDMNFRNFIVKNKQIYRIDFEEVTFGKKESDIGKLLAFGETYKPEQTEWKKEFEKDFVGEVIKSGLYDINSVVEERDLELGKINERRKKT